MALYTLKNEEEAFAPLRNYNGNDAWVRKQATSMGFATQPMDSSSTFDSNFENRYNNIQNAANSAKSQGYKTLLGSTWDTATSYLDNATKKINAGLSTNMADYNADAVRNAYSNLSSDDKWDVYQNLQKAKNEYSRAYARAEQDGNEDLKNMYAAGLHMWTFMIVCLATLTKVINHSANR